MYAEFGGHHHKPHFHAYYQERTIVYGIDPIEVLAGSFPKKQKRLVEAWSELHKAELVKDWQRLQNGQKPDPIKPLK